MTDRNALAGQLRRIAWGYFFLYLNFNLNLTSGGETWSVGLLPSFVGWWLLWKTIPRLKEERPKIMLLQNFALALLVWSALEWVPFLHVDQIGWLYGAELLFRLMTLYFHFQFLTELSQLARQNGAEEHGPRLLRVRTMAVLLQTAMSILFVLPLPVLAMAAAGFALLAVQFGVCIYTMWALFSLAKAIQEPRL